MYVSVIITFKEFMITITVCCMSNVLLLGKCSYQHTSIFQVQSATHRHTSKSNVFEIEVRIYTFCSWLIGRPNDFTILRDTSYQVTFRYFYRQDFELQLILEQNTTVIVVVIKGLLTTFQYFGAVASAMLVKTVKEDQKHGSNPIEPNMSAHQN